MAPAAVSSRQKERHKWPPQASTSLGWAPVAFCPCRRLCKIGRWVCPVSFQITASALGLGAWKILWVPFKKGIAISHNPLSLPKVSLTGLQSQMSLRSYSLCRTLGLQNLCGVQIIYPLQRSSPVVLILSFVGHPIRGMSLDYTATLRFLPVSLWSLLYTLIVEEIFW